MTVAVALAAVVTLTGSTGAAAGTRHGNGGPSPDLGPNVIILDPDMAQEEIQATFDAIAAEQVDDEMGDGRYALLFEPGTYGTPEEPLILQVGYYTEVAGLGALPTDVVINGHIDVYNRCLTPDNCIALVNFWRSLSNLTIQVEGAGLDGCRASGNFWAASQAAPMRRVKVSGPLTLMDYCTAGPQYASGGFIADSMTDSVVNGSQQQYLVRNSAIGEWSNGVWNQVFAGVDGAPADSFPDPPYTTLATTPVSREKPFLHRDARGQLQVRVPELREESSGVSWAAGQTPGRSIPLSRFYVARPSDSVRTINRELARGRHLLLTPGIYDIDRTIRVTRPGTVVLGLGLATLTAHEGVVPLRVSDVHGVDIAGLTIDAGEQSSPVLLEVGRPGRRGRHRHGGWHDRLLERDPITLHDVFFRIGGPHAGRADTSLVVNTDHVLLDHIWAWRADHGSGVGWDDNTADHGVVINGDDVTATGLFVEHYQRYNLVWNGEGGRTVLFQNELPYDPPDQAAWQHDGTLGWAGYKVADDVETHTLWGGGVYIYTNVDPSIHASRGFEVPVTPGVQLNNILTVQLGAGTIDHVVNDTGDPVNGDAVGVPSYLISYP